MRKVEVLYIKDYKVLLYILKMRWKIEMYINIYGWKDLILYKI